MILSIASISSEVILLPLPPVRNIHSSFHINDSSVRNIVKELIQTIPDEKQFGPFSIIYVRIKDIILV